MNGCELVRACFSRYYILGEPVTEEGEVDDSIANRPDGWDDLGRGEQNPDLRHVVFRFERWR
jgi:hypothetical protein